MCHPFDTLYVSDCSYIFRKNRQCCLRLIDQFAKNSIKLAILLSVLKDDECTFHHLDCHQHPSRNELALPILFQIFLQENKTHEVRIGLRELSCHRVRINYVFHLVLSFVSF